VIAIAVPSPIHQQAIKTITAKRRFPEKVIPSGSGMSKMIKNKTTPPTSTKIFFLNNNCKLGNTSSGRKEKRVFVKI
jgi:hypothetical protein